MFAFVSMACLGALLALILAVASRRFEVKTDPRVEEVSGVLPGANCGGCGFAGCAAYAEAVVLKGADPTLCSPGGAECGIAIAKILGVAVDSNKARCVALCHCQRQNVETVALYTGIQTCRGAALQGLGGGWLDCRYGCLGYGDCLKSCPFGAITFNEAGRPVVDEAKCTGCKKCVAACPRGLMAVTAINKFVHIACHNRDKGAMANKICERACIICQKCVKACPVDAITVPNNLAEIDHDKCISCGKCVAVCPHQTILNCRPARRAAEAARKAVPPPEKKTDEDVEVVNTGKQTMTT